MKLEIEIDSMYLQQIADCSVSVFLADTVIAISKTPLVTEYYCAHFRTYHGNGDFQFVAEAIICRSSGHSIVRFKDRKKLYRVYATAPNQIIELAQKLYNEDSEDTE